LAHKPPVPVKAYRALVRLDDLQTGYRAGTDVGGPASHASMIVREYGIPAVVGCGDATSHLRLLTKQEQRWDSGGARRGAR
jgi:phosphoenolpyruvate synthase/pyruvate phosphate dikinase